MSSLDKILETSPYHIHDNVESFSHISPTSANANLRAYDKFVDDRFRPQLMNNEYAQRLYSTLKEATSILDGSHKNAQGKRDAYNWKLRADLLTQTYTKLKSQLQEAQDNKAITTVDSVSVLDMFDAKVEIKFDYNKYVQGKIAKEQTPRFRKKPKVLTGLLDNLKRDYTNTRSQYLTSLPASTPGDANLIPPQTEIAYLKRNLEETILESQKKIDAAQQELVRHDERSKRVIEASEREKTRLQTELNTKNNAPKKSNTWKYVTGALALAAVFALGYCSHKNSTPKDYVNVDVPPPVTEVAPANNQPATTTAPTFYHAPESNFDFGTTIKTPKNLTLSKPSSKLSAIPAINPPARDSLEQTLNAPQDTQLVETKQVDNGQLNFSETARAQYRLLESRLDGVVLGTDERGFVSVGNTTYVHQKIGEAGQHAFHELEADTLFTERKNLDYLLYWSERVKSIGISIPNYRTPEYSVLNQEAVANGYASIEQLLRLERLAAIAKQIPHAKILGIPMPWKTAGGRTAKSSIANALAVNGGSQ